MKPEEVLGGDSVRYAMPGEIKKQLDATSKEITKLRTTEDKKALLFKIARITASIWRTILFVRAMKRNRIFCVAGSEIGRKAGLYTVRKTRGLCS